ncbi:MAG: hypothetical protein ACW98D_01325 [Promethearchaeota archaeon]
MTSGATSFKSIPFNRNPSVSTNNKLNNEGSEMFIEFEVFSDPFNVIYEADLDMDGRKEYKQEIDVDKNGRIDIVKYGIEDSKDPDKIIWYSIIQDFYSEEVIVDKTIEEEKRTEWFDIDDAAFSDYQFNILLLIASILILPLLLYTLSTMILPDVDYWAQKSITQETTETQYIKNRYYSIRRDDDMDGFTDSQITYEKSDTVVEYTSKDYEKTIIAAKPQNVFSYLGEWISMNARALLGAPTDDIVFNKFLTEDKLDNSDFSDTYIQYSSLTASTLEATYRKFTKDTTLKYVRESSQEKITVTDWAEGNIEQTRIYQDLFENNEIDYGVLRSLSPRTYTIKTNDHEESISSNSLSMTEPEVEGWDLQTWEEDIHKKFDSVTTIHDNGRIEEKNLYADQYEIEIPARFNLYDDIYNNDPKLAIKDTRFTVTGILVTPRNRRVYHTSDKELFKSGQAMSPGSYLYYDSDDDNFYETVYILENPVMEYNTQTGVSKCVYRVKSIGYNYDGTHDFAPYKRVNREILTETDFDQLASETPKKFGAFWVVNFRNLRSNTLLFPNDPFDGYEAKDHIFEVSKLSDMSEFNSKFPELFYEVRHQTYSDAWTVYARQLAQDTIEQVFMTLTASAVSGALQWLPFVGSVLGTLAYIGVYTLMTKFNMDLKRHKAESMSKAFTFTPVSLDEVKSISLNERSTATHGYWEESTIAALMGHPGAYYTTIQGQTKNRTYTAQAIVSPASLLRDNSNKNQQGFGAFLWDTLLKGGNSNPDLMIGLDFDNLNLDYFLLTTELPSLNDNPDYTFRTSAYNGLYNQYRYNTLGYLQQKVAEASEGELSIIKPIMIDGRPEYIFVDGTDEFNHLTMPAPYLYQPIVVNKDLGKRNEGTITVNIKTAYETNTKGISTRTSYPESNIYSSKVPLSSHGFEYPITSIKLEFMEESRSVDSITFTSDLESFNDMFNLEFGNLYFIDDIDTMVIADRAEYDAMINDGSLSVGTKKYYKLTLKFDMIIADTTEETNKMALRQATAYSIMDYMNQYTFAKTTAEMIAEISYTEVLTLISSAISAASMVLGSWAVQGLKGVFAQAGVSLTKQLLTMLGQFAYSVVIGSVKEMFEEIIVDGFLETWGEKWIKSIGGNDDMAFWFSSLLTSGREALGGVRSVVMKGLGKTSIAKNIRTKVNNRFGINQKSDIALRNEYIEMVNEQNTNEKGKNKNKIDKIKSWKHIVGSGLLSIMLSIIPALFTGGMFFTNFMSVMGIASQIEGISGDVIGRYGTILNIDRSLGANGINLLDLHGRLERESQPLKTKPDINKAQIDQKYIESFKVRLTAVKQKMHTHPSGRPDVKAMKRRFHEIFTIERKMERAIRTLASQSKLAGLKGFLQDQLLQRQKARNSENAVKITTPESIPIPKKKATFKWGIHKSSNQLSISGPNFKPKISEMIDIAKSVFAKERGMYAGKKMVIIWDGNLIYPGALFLDAKTGKVRNMEDRPIADIIIEMGLSTENNPTVQLVPFSAIRNNPKYKAFYSQIFNTEVTTLPKAFFFRNDEARKFYYETFNYYFWNQFEFVVGTDDYIKDFETAFEWIKEIGTSAKSTFKFEKEILKEKLNAEGQKTLDHTETFMLESHFESYFGINEFQGEYKEAYKKLVSTLYDTMTLPGFLAASDKTLSKQEDYNQEVKNKLNTKIDFAILTLLMEQAGITQKDLKTQDFPEKLRTYLANPNNKKELRKIFRSEQGKQRILDNFLSTFLVVSPKSEKIISTKSIYYFGYDEEVRYNLFRLSIRMKSIFKQLIQKVENSKYTITDLLNIKIYDKMTYDPKEAEYSNKLNLDYGNVVFFDKKSGAGRQYDGLGIIEILGFILSTEIKSTMFDTMFDSPHDLPNDLANDGISSMINSFINLIDFKDLSNINDLMLNLKTRIVQLVAPTVSPGSAPWFVSDSFSSETWGNVEKFFRNFFRKGISDLGTKLEDHELFLVDVVKIINSKISASTEHVDNDIPTIRTFITKLFKDDDFRDQVNTIASHTFNSPFYPNELLKTSKYNDLKNMIINNLKSLRQEGADARLGLSYDYDPHFKSTEKLSVSDFPGRKIYVVGRLTPITNNNDLSTYRNNFKGALKVYHRRQDRRVYLVPVSQMKKNLKDSEGSRLYPGYLDEDGGVHQNIFVADAEGYKLNSKFIFTEIKLRMHKNPRWTDNFIEFDIDNDILASEGIVVYTSNFYAAYSVISGDTIVSGLQNTIINLEHIDSTPHVLPNLEFKRKFESFNSRVIKKSHISLDMQKRIDSLISVIEQLTNAKSTAGEVANIKVDDYFFNLFSEEDNRYTVEKFKLILKILNLKNTDFTKLTRGRIQSNGKFNKNDITPQQFYEEWFNIIKNDLNRDPPLVFGEPKSLKSVTFTGSIDQIAMIDAALQDVFGYPAFICLLGGIMVFGEDSSQDLGYKINFVKHNQEDQATLLRDFLGRTLHDSNTKAIANQFLSGQLRRFPVRTFYWAETFLFGFRRGNVFINPPNSYFTNNYYDIFEPEIVSDFSFATEGILRKYYSEFISVPTKNQKHIDGRLEFFDLMNPKLKESLRIEQRRVDPNIYHSGYEIILTNQLMKNIDAPSTQVNDFVSRLENIGTTTLRDRFNLGVAYEGAGRSHWIGFEMSRNGDLIPAIDGSKLTIDAFLTWRESYRVVKSRETGYFLDFDIALNSGLDQDLIDGYEKIKEMFDMVPKSASPLKIELYARGKHGIDRNNPIKQKINAEGNLVRPEYIDTNFKLHEIEVNLNSPSQAIISLLLWMMIEPNIFSVVKWGSDNFLYLDIFDLYDQSHIQSGTIAPKDRIQGSFTWTEGAGGTFTPEAYEQFRNSFSRIFMSRDIRYFLGFHNHETDSRYNNIIDYIKYKVLNLFKARKNIDKDTEILDLRA